MCASYELDADPEALVAAFRVDHGELTGPVEREHFPRMVAPIVMTRAASPEHPRAERWLGQARWGFVPFWAKALTEGDKLFNARAETLSEKPAFRDAFARRRCIVPVTAFYEWRKEGKRSQRFVLRASAGGLFALAGLWSSWRSPAGDKTGTYTVITVPPNGVVAPIHDRMPAVLTAQAVESWLDPSLGPAELHGLLAPCADELLAALPG
jgi:putative SOS response-associated peptidase YedK